MAVKIVDSKKSLVSFSSIATVLFLLNKAESAIGKNVYLAAKMLNAAIKTPGITAELVCVIRYLYISRRYSVLYTVCTYCKRIFSYVCS